MTLMERPELAERVSRALHTAPVVALIGPRQCGKTTLARGLAARRKDTTYLDLEDPADQARLAAPMTALAPLSGLVVIDEAQLEPGLFPILRVLVDRTPSRTRFLLLGSASPDLVRHIAESLAGRITFVEMGGFDLKETGAGALRRLWWRGGFPRAYLARSDAASAGWREDFIRTFLERDLRRFGVQVAAATLRRFWQMLAHHHGQILNASEIGRALGEAHTTIRRHLDILSGALVVRQLAPWFENIGKRQVRSPKVYLRDSGLLHSLLGISSFAALEGHPKLGASWEGFVIEQILCQSGERDAYFWATPAGAEIDLVLFRGGRRLGFEIKYADGPRHTKSMRIALADLRLDQIFVVYPGAAAYRIAERIDAVPIAALAETLDGLAIAGARPRRRPRPAAPTGARTK